MTDAMSIHEFLHEARVPYTVVPHRAAFTAQEEAAAMHVPGRDWAKVVVCVVDGRRSRPYCPRRSRSISSDFWSLQAAARSAWREKTS